MPTYIDQLGAEITRIQSIINANGVGAINGQVHQDNEVAQANDAYQNLLPHDNTASKFVRTVVDPADNGTNLLAAYADAITLTPGGDPLSANNRVTLFLLPGVYHLGTASLVMDTEFVDIVGLSTNEAQVIIITESVADGTGAIVHLADNTQIRNVSLMRGGSAFPSGTSADAAAYYPTGGLQNVLLENVTFLGNSNGSGPSTRTGVDYAGSYTNCRASGVFPASSGMFGYNNGSCSGTFDNCHTSGPGFGAYGSIEASAVLSDCSAGSGFGTNTLSGKLSRCVAESKGFAHAGLMLGATLTDCHVNGSEGFGGILIDSDSTLTDCSCPTLGFGADVGGAGLEGTFIRCRGVGGAFGPFGGSLSGTFEDCSGGQNSFGGGGYSELSGTLTGCTAGNNSFGSGTRTIISGTLTGCTAGNNSFGGPGYTTISGTLTNCIAGSDSYGSSYSSTPGAPPTTITSTALFRYCSAGTSSFARTQVQHGGSPAIRCEVEKGARYEFCQVVGIHGFGANSLSAGLYEFCTSGNNGFTTSGGVGSQYAEFIDCKAGDESFQWESQFDQFSRFIRCKSGNKSFGYGFAWTSKVKGTYIDCEGGTECFGTLGAQVTGTLLRCTAGDNSFNGTVLSAGIGTYEYCVGGNNCFTFDGSYSHGVFTHCRAKDFSFGAMGAAPNNVAGNARYVLGRFVGCVGGDYCFGSAIPTISNPTATAFAIGSLAGQTAVFKDCHGGANCFYSLTYLLSLPSSVMAQGTATFDNCTAGANSFMSVTNSSATTTTVLAGGVVTLNNCTAGANSFFRAAANVSGGTVTMVAGSGQVTMSNCVGAANCFFSGSAVAGATVVINLKVILNNCTGKDNSFASQISGSASSLMGGRISDCKGGNQSFAGNGGTLSAEVTNCALMNGDELGVMQWAGKLSGSMDNCLWVVNTGDCVQTVVPNVKIRNSLLISETGFFSVTGGIPANVSHCRMNTGIGGGTTNAITTPYNVVDVDV